MLDGGVALAVPSFLELAQPGTDDEDAGQGGPATGAVHDGGTGEVLESHTVQPAAAPGPGADDGVDDGGEDQHEQEEGPELDPLGQGAGHDGRGGGDEDHLEEPVGHGGVGVVAGEDGRGVAFALDERNLLGRRSVEQLERADEVADEIAVHQVVAEDEVGESGYRVEADVLQTDHGGVLGPHGPGLEHGEAGAHPHDQRAPDQEREGVEHVDDFGFDAVRLRHRGPGQEDAEGRGRG